MIKKNKLALSAAATALIAVTGLAVAPQASADEMADLKERIARIEQQEAVKATRGNGHMVFFRGGYARNNVDRSSQILTSGNNVLGTNDDKSGWYVGAGLDLNLSDDMFGLDDNTQLVGEIMFEYKNFSSFDPNAAGDALGNPLNALVGSSLPAAVGTNQNSVTVSQFTLTASPKIKFMKNTWFNPWIIPVGLAIHVISPPSDGVTVLLPGMHFGAGADFKVWKNVYVGIDARYNLTFQSVDGVDINGFTTGAYAGFGF
ncbi:MAG: porin family protein [Methyloprofundus sp.]|nr:porin family protein [Methyloprofundus sp.]